MREYKRKLGSRKYKDYTDASFDAAIRMVNDGSTLREAATAHGIHHTTLSRRLRGITTNLTGRPTVLSNEEEENLVSYIAVLSTWGFPVNEFEIRQLVKNFLDRRGKIVDQFRNNFPGPDWASSFLKRHKDALSARLANNIKSTRANVGREKLEEYFTNLKESLAGVPPENILNYDETNLSDDPGRKKVIAKRGLK